MSPNVRSFRDIIGVPRSSASVHDSTLIIIDAQNEYASGNLQVSDVTTSRKVIADLLARYRGAGDGKNIVHVVHQTSPNAPVFTTGTALEQEFEELTPTSGEMVVKKQFPNCFARTDLNDYLKSLGARGEKIVVLGYMAHVCVSTTTRAAGELGYEVLVARDAVGDRDIPGVDAETLKSVALSELGDGFGTVISANEVNE